MFNKHSKQGFPTTFDQNAMEISFQHGQTQLQEIKISHKWVAGQLKSRLPVLNCQWFNKTQESMDLIEGVTEQCYQPSILDVSTMIYVQIVPESKDMEYIGMPITKLIGPLSLSPDTEEQVNELMEAQKSTYFVQCKELRLKNTGKTSENSVKDTLLKIVKNKLTLMGKSNTSDKPEPLIEVQITRKYPQLILNRKSTKEVTIKFNLWKEAKIIFQGNRIRDVFCLLMERIKKQAEQEVEKEEEQAEIESQSSIAKQEKHKSLESLSKSEKSEERLPLSPQSQDIPKEQRQIKEERIEVEGAKPQKDQDCKQEISKLLENLHELQETKEKLEKESELIKQSHKNLQQKLRCLNEEKIKAQEEACYHKNQSRILKEDLQRQRSKLLQLQTELNTFQLKTSVSLSEDEARTKYGSHFDMNFNELLQQLHKKQKESNEFKYKNNYQAQRIDSLENDLRVLKEDIENNQDIIKKLQKKMESLNQAKKIGVDQVKTQHTHSHQLGSYQFEIGKLKEEINIVTESARVDNEAKQKLIESLKIQVKELIEENTYLRSKDKSSKGELKHEAVELKKLINRFAESITEKDMQIEQLKMTNKELNKEMVALKESK